MPGMMESVQFVHVDQHIQARVRLWHWQALALLRSSGKDGPRQRGKLQTWPSTLELALSAESQIEASPDNGQIS